MTDLPTVSLALDNQLCFKLYAASRAVTRAYKPMLDQLGLTYQIGRASCRERVS